MPASLLPLGQGKKKMPLAKGTDPKTVSKNISEFHKGKTFAATRKKFGKKRADKQAIAAALSQKRKSGRDK